MSNKNIVKALLTAPIIWATILGIYMVTSQILFNGNFSGDDFGMISLCWIMSLLPASFIPMID
ncbi:MAG: hypothetical protein WCT51_04880 [Candidatus Shapirobacteria bacterium]|jgi:hypothetical protein